MSGFVSSVATGVPLLLASDSRAVDDEWDRADEFQPAPIIGLIFANSDFLGVDDWSTDWWPGQGYTLDTGGVSDVKAAAYYQRVWPNSGCNGRLSFAGVTRDQYGSAAANCTVRCYRVSTGELVSQVTSDISGTFIATSPYSEAHFLTVHRTGPPDIAGASVDTLVPA